MYSAKPSIATVILSWNDPKNTFELIKSILDSSYEKFDIIVVDNNSTEENFDKLKNLLKQDKLIFNVLGANEKFETELHKKNIFLIRSTKIAKIKHARNLGVSRGYNLGIKLALQKNYNFLVKIDCDFIISKNFLDGMIETFQKYPNAVAVSPKVYYYIEKPTSIIWWDGLNLDKNYIRFQRTGKGSRRKLDNGEFKGIKTSDGICGCCVMLKSSVIEKTGLLNEDFFFGPEDIEHSHRLIKFGTLLVNLDYFVYHKVSQSIYVSGLESRIYFETVGWLTLIKKVCSVKDKFLGYSYFLVRFFYHLLRIILKKDKRVHKGFILGFIDFFKNK